MFSRCIFDNHPETQGQILSEVADLIDDGVLVPIDSENLPVSAENFSTAHAALKAGTMLGKFTLEF